MLVQAVSSVKYDRNVVPFGNDKKDQQKVPVTYPERSTSDLKTVPVIVLMAMNPALLNAKELPYIEPEPNTIEMAVQPEPGVTYKNLPEDINDETVIYKRRFKAENKMWTMYYTNIDKANRPDFVMNIEFVPDDYRQKIKNNRELNRPPIVNKIIYHKTGPETEFIGAYIIERRAENGKLENIRREMRLPDDVANEITALLSDETEYRPNKYMVQRFTIVDTNEMIPTTIEPASGRSTY